MALIDLEQRVVTAKIVYYGPGLSGKTTNLQALHGSLHPDKRGKLASIATESERTLFFDFMAVNTQGPSGYSMKFNLFTVPGQSFYNQSRRAVLEGADGVVFVADSAPERQDANLDSWLNMIENLHFYGQTVDDVSIVVQYNKRDLPFATAVEEMRGMLGVEKYDQFETVAINKQGVIQTMRSILQKVIQKTTP